MDNFYVTEKTKVKCTWGLVPFKQLDEQGHGVFKMNGNTPMPVMNMMDNRKDRNIPNFQRCKNILNPDVLKENPDAGTPTGLAKIAATALTVGACSCSPVFPAPWINASMLTHTDGKPTLNKNSCLACAKGFGLITIEGMTAGNLISFEEIEENYIHIVEGVGYDAQKDLNHFFMENVWNDSSLSNDSKIAIMVANYDAMTPEQKEDYNILGDARVLKCGDFCDWIAFDPDNCPPVSWPDFPGLDKDGVEGLSPENMPEKLDRIGSLYGKNFGTMRDEGNPFTQDARAITYLDNEYAYHSYDIDTENYFKALDCIADGDKRGLNELIGEINRSKAFFRENIPYISEKEMKNIKEDYDKFFRNPKLKELVESKKINAKYGLIGKAARWEVNGNIIGQGGAGQLNSPVVGKTLERLGILVEKKGNV